MTPYIGELSMVKEHRKPAGCSVRLQRNQRRNTLGTAVSADPLDRGIGGSLNPTHPNPFVSGYVCQRHLDQIMRRIMRPLECDDANGHFMFPVAAVQLPNLQNTLAVERFADTLHEQGQVAHDQRLFKQLLLRLR